jgi:hypothetical protein
MIALLALVLCMASLPGAGAQESTTTYGPPFEEGPSGGDSWAMSSADTEDGTVTVGRAYPIFNPIQCAPGGAMAKLQVTHEVTTPISGVTVTFSDAAVDPYTFVTLAVRTPGGRWLASTRQRGPLIGDGEVQAPLFRDSPEEGETVLVQFGLEMASACPQVGGGTGVFNTLTVS